jgi:hypothetical protein
MPLWNTTSDVFSDVTSDTVRSKTFNVPADVSGLKAKTNYDFYLDGVQYNWACKPFGRQLGDQLVSDPEGKLKFNFLYDFQYEGNYAFDNLPATPVTGSQYNQQETDSYYYFTTTRFIELKGANSYASAYFPLRLLIIPSHVNNITSHQH